MSDSLPGTMAIGTFDCTDCDRLISPSDRFANPDIDEVVFELDCDCGNTGTATIHFYDDEIERIFLDSGFETDLERGDTF